MNAFVEMVRYLLSGVPDGEPLYFLSERISQDPIENYFGKQRARGGRNENPNLQQCVHNAATLRVQKSFALNPIRGNCRRKRLSYSCMLMMMMIKMLKYMYHYQNEKENDSH